ncbi:MAG: ankyrin repeat domain-containing protein [Shewanella sp.]|nr:ankyrin repeat domain-containing protein [Shewanella sp.]
MAVPISQLVQLTQSNIHQLASEVEKLKSSQDEIVIRVIDSEGVSYKNFKVSLTDDLYLTSEFHTDQIPTPAIEVTLSDVRGSASTLNNAISNLSRHLNQTDDALIEACRTGNSQTVKELASKGANVNKKDPKNVHCAPLFIAAKSGSLECVTCLVENGADVNIENDEKLTPLSTASYRGYIYVVKHLLTHNAVADGAKDAPFTPLMYAAMAGHNECVKELLLKDSDIGIKGSNGDTALSLAARYGHNIAVNLLIERDDFGFSENFDIDAIDENGYTALSLAASEGHHECVKILISKGANIDIKNKNNYTALQCAKSKKHTKCIKLLENQMGTSSYKSSLNPLSGVLFHNVGYSNLN